MVEGAIRMGQPRGPCLEFILETMGALGGVIHSYLHFRKIASTEVRKLYLRNQAGSKGTDYEAISVIVNKKISTFKNYILT